MKDLILDKIISDLIQHHKCHCVILYGSRARGDHTAKSDYDVLGIVKDCKIQHIAEYDNLHDIYKDIFVVPESEFVELKTEYFRLSDGICILDENDFGRQLLLSVKDKLEQKPNLDAIEINTRKLWYGKMINRVKVGDLEGKYRAIWIVYALLEDYFIFRNMHYLGPKKAMRYLQEHDLAIYNLFDIVLADCNDINNMQQLISKICMPEW